MTHLRAGQMRIDLAALRRNYQMLRARVGDGVTVAGVVKANAYGLGVEPVVQALLAEGCDLFCVANIAEAQLVRALTSMADIVVFNGFAADEADAYIAGRFTAVLANLDAIAAYQDLADAQARALPAYLHMNTGMNRMGLGVSDVKMLGDNPDLLRNIDVRCVMSHLACADEADHPMNAEQRQRFETLYARLGIEASRSFANSSGIFLGADYHYDIVRPGMALYGLNPTPYAAQCPTEPVVQVDIPVIGKRIFRVGETVGYGATYTAPRDMDIVTTGAGYADGVFRSLSNKGAFYWNGVRCPILGRVSMDMTCVDVSALPAAQQPDLGDYLEYIGPHQSAADIGADADGSFDYEIITALSQRYDRAYEGAEVVPLLQVSSSANH